MAGEPLHGGPIDGAGDDGAGLLAANDAARVVGMEMERRYRVIAEGPMRDMPLCNPVLPVAAVGFAAVGGFAVGIVTTPWFMNLTVTALPNGSALPAARIGDTVTHGLPSGEFDCVVGMLEGFGRIDCVSLFSPMFEFADGATVRATAEAAIAEILTAPPMPVPQSEAKLAAAIDRRALLFGRRTSIETGRTGEGDRTCR